MSEKIRWVQAVRTTSFKNIKYRDGRFIDTGPSSSLHLNEGDRIHLKDQTLPSENGIYRVSNGPSYVWVRTSDFLLGKSSYRAGVLADYQMSTWVQTENIEVGSESTKWVSEEEFLKKFENIIIDISIGPVITDDVENTDVLNDNPVQNLPRPIYPTIRPPPAKTTKDVDLLGLFDF